MSFNPINLIIFIHFLIVLFITFLLFFIPIGYKFSWKFMRNKKLRLTHFLLMSFVTIETILGIACPLTTIENYLSDNKYDKTFISFWMEKVISWDFPSSFFIILYSACLTWIIIMWKIYPPQKK